MDENYELCKEVCNDVKPSCRAPKCSGEFNKVIANTPEWIRRYFFAKGLNKSMELINKADREEQQDE